MRQISLSHFTDGESEGKPITQSPRTDSGFVELGSYALLGFSVTEKKHHKVMNLKLNWGFGKGGPGERSFSSTSPYICLWQNLGYGLSSEAETDSWPWYHPIPSELLTEPFSFFCYREIRKAFLFMVSQG
jgi:hypothetical protein